VARLLESSFNAQSLTVRAALAGRKDMRSRRIGGGCPLPIVAVLLLLGLLGQPGSANVCGVLRGSLIPVSDTVAVAVCSDSIVRVVKVPSGSQENASANLLARNSLMVQQSFAAKHVDFKYNRTTKTIYTKRLIVSIQENDSLVFTDAATKKLLTQEKAHRFSPKTDVDGKGQYQTFSTAQAWSLVPGEALYGGGGFQNGIIDYADVSINLIQFNTEAIVPFFISSTGYGILWDNNGRSMLNPPDSILQRRVPFIEKNGANATVVKTFVPQEGNGDYSFYIDMCPDYGCGFSHFINLTIVPANGGDLKTIQYWDELSNLPDGISGRALGLVDGVEYTVYFTCDMPNVQVYVAGPLGHSGKGFVLQSDIAPLIDYYFVWDPATFPSSMDGAIARYRDITGASPLYGEHVYGFWQCKEHYHNQTELLSAAAKFRALKIPVDNFVQDWRYWGTLGWGPQWDHTVYPDPRGMVEALHDENIRFMVSVWSKFDNFTSFYKAMHTKGHILGESTYYDPWSAEARDLFYQFSKKAHFSIGVDSLWLDATEPEGFPHENQSIALGAANAYFNTYSLMTTKAIADGMRADYSAAQGRRVFSLTRSSFAGQQRTGAALWSGDIQATWDSLRRQISSSLNYQMSGMPYWSEDIGGFFRPVDQYTNPQYHTLLIRWFQFGCFTPIFRVHGGASNTELWNYGQAVQDVIVQSTIRLRYRLLPYIYSGFWKVGTSGWTMQRAMVMDYQKDPTTYQMNTQFMFGSELLVAPLYTEAHTREVYFPSPSESPQTLASRPLFYNFFSGRKICNSGSTTVTVPMNEIALFVKAGSILPLGPDLQYTREKLPDPLYLRVYPGADGDFILYEDDGESADFLKSTTISFHWNDADSKLSISARSGNGFVGMLTNRSFHIVRVCEGHGTGVDIEMKPDKIVSYDGAEAIDVKVPQREGIKCV
jgi:alpha-D-xyloside xylohydrolase